MNISKERKVIKMASTKKLRKQKKYVLSENQQIRHLFKNFSTESYLMYADSCYKYGHTRGKRVASKMMKRYHRENQKST